jgi:hypothetical protein
MFDFSRNCCSSAKAFWAKTQAEVLEVLEAEVLEAE